MVLRLMEQLPPDTDCARIPSGRNAIYRGGHPVPARDTIHNGD
jgi:hypothetical protein